MRKIVFYIWCMLMLWSNVTQSQSRAIVKADKYYSKYSYALAFQQYEHAKTKDTEVYRKMAKCQFQLENFAMADTFWRKVCSSADANADDYIQYAMVLRMNGKMDQSLDWMNKAGKKNPKDARVQKFNDNIEEIKKCAKDNGRYVITHLSMNTADQDFSPFLLDSSIVFSSSREGIFPVRPRWNGNGKPFLDLYQGKLDKSDEVLEINRFSKVMKSPFHDGPIYINKKGDYAVFTRNNGDKKNKEALGALALFETKKVNGNWEVAVPLNCNSEQYSCGHAALTSDGNTMYFASDMPGGKGGTDIYRMRKKEDGSWSKPENMGEPINTEGNELFPFIHESGLLIFASNGHAGLGGLDLFVAKMDGDRVRKLINAGAPLNSTYDDFSLSLNGQCNMGYFASNRKGGKGSDDIYKVNILTPWEFEKEMNISIRSNEGLALSNAKILVKDENGNVIQEVTTDSDGKINVKSTDWTVIHLECEYPGFEPVMDIKNAKEMANGEWVELVANKIPHFTIVGNVSELQSGLGMDQVKVNLENNQSHLKNLLYSDSKGQFKMELEKGYRIGEQLTFKIQCNKKGYLPLEEDIVLKLDKEGEINISTFMDLRMEKIEVGKDLGKMLSVNPIYFDLGKSDIRPDAAAELDKIIAYMNENPVIEIELGSHTDCRGSKASNEKLSAARAKSSADYIKARISNPKRIYGKGYGESKLVNQCECEGKKTSPCTEEEHQANRRTEFKVVKI